MSDTRLSSLTKSEKISLGTKEIAKRIRQQLKQEFKKCKFSVRIEFYSMGSSISVYLMIADRKLKRDFDSISELTLFSCAGRGYTREQLEEMQNKDYHQLNEFILRGEWDERYWCNGVFLTESGHNFLKRVVEIVDQYNYNDSDSQSDYYSVNFSFSLSLGRWDKPFIDARAV